MEWVHDRPVARIDFGVVRDPPKVDLFDPKGGLFEPHPLNPPSKTPFLVHFVAKSGPFGRFGGVSHPPHPPGYGPGPWLVPVSPCFRKNLIATCNIGYFLCSLDNLLQKNVIVLFFGNQISKWSSFEKRAIFDLLFTFSSHQGKGTKIPSAHISNTYIHVFCSPY